MPRKKTKSLIRTVKPDQVYNSIAITKLINRVMLNGKKDLAQKIVYSALQKAANNLKIKNPYEVFEQAIKNIQPHIETRSRRIGGANYQIPFDVKPQRQQHLTIMWLVQFSRSKKGIPMEDRLAAELVDAYNNQGGAVKKKEEVHKMAESNRAFAHFAKY